MDKSTNSRPRKPLFILTGLLILFIISAAFCFQRMRLNSQIKTLTNDLRVIEASTTEIQKTLPALRQLSELVLVQILPDLVPLENDEEWCTELLHYPHMPDNFKCSHRIREPKIPIQMKLPRELRDTVKHIHPGIIPFQVEVNVDGTLSWMCYFLSEIDRLYPKMIVSKIDLRPADKIDTFKGRMTLSFPQLQYPEDIEEINRFVEKNAAQASELADLQ